MSDPIANLCIEVTQATVKIALEPNQNSQNPIDPPYYFRVWDIPDGQGSASSGESVELTSAGTYRVSAWTRQDPGTVPSSIFEAPTAIDPGVQASFADGEYALTSASEEDPWPKG